MKASTRIAQYIARGNIVAEDIDKLLVSRPSEPASFDLISTSDHSTAVPETPYATATQAAAAINADINQPFSFGKPRKKQNRRNAKW